MPVGDDAFDALPVGGVRLGAAVAGLRGGDHPDLAVMALEGGATAAVFTSNRLQAAPVLVAREHLHRSRPRLLVVNSGVANVATGEAGMTVARETCAAAAEAHGVRPDEVVPFSTGVIGEPLPLEPLQGALPAALEALDGAGWQAAADAIRTTDTRPKGAHRRLDLGGVPVTVSGIAKGSGMIHPNMATMLAFVATDAPVADGALDLLVRQAVADSFNRISVDGDTSTNDALTLSATGAAGGEAVAGPEDPRFAPLAEAVTAVCRDLAHSVVRDGEGATRFITVTVNGAAETAEADAIADRIARSPLVKTACFAGDPNWGRILMAAGAGAPSELDWSAVSLAINGVRVVTAGQVDPGYSEEAGVAAMADEELTLALDLGRGAASGHKWTCDFSYDYVRINADYRS